MIILLTYKFVQTVKALMHDNVTLSGGTVNSEGRRAVVKLRNLDGFPDPKIQSITVTGGNQPTKAERRQYSNILLALQKKLPLFDKYWIKRLYLSGDQQYNTAENCEDENNWVDDWGSTDHPWGSSVTMTATDGENDDPWTSDKGNRCFLSFDLLLFMISYVFFS